MTLIRKRRLDGRCWTKIQELRIHIQCGWMRKALKTDPPLSSDHTSRRRLGILTKGKFEFVPSIPFGQVS